MTEGSLHKPQLNRNSLISFYKRLYQHCNTAGHLETIYLPPDLFSWFHGLRNSEGWLFQRRKKRLLDVHYKGRLMPFKWTITNGVDMLLSKMNEVSLERQNSSNKSLCLGHAIILGDSFGLPSFFIIKDILGAFIIQQAHSYYESVRARTHISTERSRPSAKIHYHPWI